MTIEIDRDPPVAVVGTLFREYADSLSFPLDFQDFDGELAQLPGPYGPPRGALLLARAGGKPAGCAALRELDGRTAELKRLFVRPRHRGLGVGRQLTESAIRIAEELGYARIRLDTTPEMVAAQGLYAALGFREIAPYRSNPIPGTRYLELILDPGRPT